MRTIIVAALLLLTADLASAQRHAIFTTGNGEDGFYLTPIVQVSRVGGTTRWEGVDRTIAGPYFAVGREYPTQLDLRPGPHLRITKLLHEAFGCDETESYLGVAEPAPTGPVAGSGLAGDLPGLLHPSPGLRAPRAPETTMLQDTVVRVLGQLGIPAAALDSVAWLQSVADSLPDGTVVLAASWWLLNPQRWSGESVQGSIDRYAAGILILERRRGRWRVVYDSHRSDSEVEYRRTEILGIADLDGDGLPEILVEDHFYESWRYSILARHGGRWTTAWESAIEGC